MVHYLAVQPDNAEAIDFTWLDEWDDETTDAEIVSAWSRSLGIEISAATVWEAAEVIAKDPRYAVYIGCSEAFIEIFRKTDLPADVEYEEA